LDGDSAYGKIRQVVFSRFDTRSRTMTIHYKGIFNFFDNRSTNASALFEAKITAYRHSSEELGTYIFPI